MWIINVRQNLGDALETCERDGLISSLCGAASVVKLYSFSKIVVWIIYKFDNNFGIENNFTKYLKESCW